MKPRELVGPLPELMDLILRNRYTLATAIEEGEPRSRVLALAAEGKRLARIYLSIQVARFWDLFSNYGQEAEEPDSFEAEPPWNGLAHRDDASYQDGFVE